MKEFRQSNDIRLPQKTGAATKEENKKVKLAIADQFAFGKPNRPSTPINGVISNYYGASAN